MSTSIGKNKYLFQQILVMITRIVIISMILGTNFFVFANLFDLELDLKNLTAIIFHLILLSLSIGSFSLLIGSITGNKSTTLGLSAGIAVLSYFINSLMSSSFLLFFPITSDFHTYLMSSKIPLCLPTITIHHLL